jgi:hypothetical protein
VVNSEAVSVMKSRSYMACWVSKVLWLRECRMSHSNCWCRSGCGVAHIYVIDKYSKIASRADKALDVLLL